MARSLVASVCLALLVTAAYAGFETPAQSRPPAEDGSGVASHAPSATEVLFLYGDRLRAGDREGAVGLLVPRADESNTLMDDEMRRWSAGLLDFVMLDQHVAGDVAIFPIVWTGNTAADATVLVRRAGAWKACYLPDYKVLAGYEWDDKERAAIRAALVWFYDRRDALNRQAAGVTARQGGWSDRAPGPIHSRVETDPDWRRKAGLRETPPDFAHEPQDVDAKK